MKKWIAAVLAVIVALPGSADRQREFTATLEQIERGLAAEAVLMSRGGEMGLVWGEATLLYMPDRGKYTLELVDLVSGKQRRLLDHSKLEEILPNGDCELLGMDGSAQALRYLCADDIYRVNTSTAKASSLEGGGIEERLSRPQLISDQFPTTFGPLLESPSPDGSRFVTVRDHNLYLRAAGSSELRQLTDDGHLYETWQNSQESAQEFNAFWSADSKTIASVQLDTRKVWHEPTPQFLENPPRTVPVAYPRAGEPIHEFRLFLIDAATGKRIPVQTGDTRGQYVDIIGWQGDDLGLLYQVLDREHKNRRIYRADRSDGSTRLLLEDKTGTYHDSWMTLFIDFAVPLAQSNGFLYLTERNGWRHIESYDGSGLLQARVTSGDWAVERIVHVDEAEGYVYFLAAMDQTAPYNLQLYRSPLSSDKAPQLLSSGKASSAVRVSPDGQYFVLRHSAPDLPPQVEVRKADGSLLTRLGQFDDTALQAAGFGGVETLLVPDSSGKWKLPVTVMRPYGFDPGKSYPVIEHIYGGMQAIHTRHQYYGFDGGRVDDVTRMLLQAGYVVVRVDAPGTPGRGRKFQDETYGRWPQGVIDNHVSAIRAVARSRPWMDIGRVGIYGHSWGSYMAQRAMIDAPEFYLAAAAHNGGSDFYDQPTYIEPFMGLPASNPEGYAAASNLARVDEIEGPILAFTAPFDVNSGFSPAFKLTDAMIIARKDIEVVVTPSSNHRMNCCGDPETLFKLAKIRRFFDREVKAGNMDDEELLQ